MCDKWGTDLELDELEVEVKVGHSSFNLVLKRHGEVGFVEHDNGVIELGHEVRVDVPSESLQYKHRHYCTTTSYIRSETSFYTTSHIVRSLIV